MMREADRLWSLLVRHGSGVKCQWPGCGKTNVSAHHVFGRRHLGVRWNLCNGVSLCPGHHLFTAHKEPEIFRDWFTKRIGMDAFNTLKVLAYSPQKVDVEMILIGLRLAAKEAGVV